MAWVSPLRTRNAWRRTSRAGHLCACSTIGAHRSPASSSTTLVDGSSPLRFRHSSKRCACEEPDKAPLSDTTTATPPNQEGLSNASHEHEDPAVVHGNIRVNPGADRPAWAFPVFRSQVPYEGFIGVQRA